jgi:hypothetical protein
MWEFASLCPIDLIARNINLAQGESTATYIVSALTDNPYGACKVKKMDLSKTNLGKKGIRLLMQAFAVNTSVVYLDLS